MYLQHIINIMNFRRLSGAQLAQRCHLSRAAVSKWFASPDDFINVETQTARTVAQVLDIPLPRLFEPIQRLSQFETSFLWDRLYPSMETFVMAVMREDPVAMARFVQVLGLFKAEAVLGKKIVAAFPNYKHHIKPARRKGLEILWPLLVSTP
jgi:transcriptional regulator with XRE-family HTH domain